MVWKNIENTVKNILLMMCVCVSLFRLISCTHNVCGYWIYSSKYTLVFVCLFVHRICPSCQLIEQIYVLSDWHFHVSHLKNLRNQELNFFKHAQLIKKKNHKMPLLPFHLNLQLSAKVNNLQNAANR